MPAAIGIQRWWFSGSVACRSEILRQQNLGRLSDPVFDQMTTMCRLRAGRKLGFFFATEMQP